MRGLDSFELASARSSPSTSGTVFTCGGQDTHHCQLNVLSTSIARNEMFEL